MGRRASRRRQDERSTRDAQHLLTFESLPPHAPVTATELDALERLLGSELRELLSS
jgi:hypothetical protein